MKNVTNPPNGVAADNPDAAELAMVLSAPMITRGAGFDTDSDGMPNRWETAIARQVFPAGAAAQQLQDAVETSPVVGARSPASA